MTTHPKQPQDSDFEKRVRHSFASQPFMDLIGARITEVSPGGCAIYLPYKPELTQQTGYFHAGIVSTMADNAGGYAALSLMPPGKEVLTVEYKINLLHPGKGDGLFSRGRVLKAGRTLTVCLVDVFNVTGETQTLAATALMTMMGIDVKNSASRS